MKNHPIYKNLDTSFVNVSALVRYLRRRGFVGNVRVELSGYEAEIFLGEGNTLRVREHDRIAGRVAEGEEALQRILIRSREPGGIVNVFQLKEEEIIEAKTEKTKEKAVKPIQKMKPTAVLATANTANGKTQTVPKAEIKETVVEKPKPNAILPNLPFEFSNKVESRAKKTAISPSDWQILVNLTGELLATVDQTLAAANLDFSAAFQKARIEISADYPFMNPAAQVFEYKNGKILLREQPNAKLFSASILEALRRIIEKLGTNPKFSETHRTVTQKILSLLHQRRAYYDKFSMTKTLEKILGV